MSKLLREIVSENIRRFRIEAGLTQVELARRAKLTDVYISRVEQGSRNLTLDSVEQIAAALEVPIVYLIQGSKQIIPKVSSVTEKSLRHAIRVLEAYLQSGKKR